MIARDVEWVGASPRQLENLLGMFGADRFRERKGLLIFHAGGRVIKAVDTNDGIVPLEGGFHIGDLEAARTRFRADYALAIDPEGLGEFWEAIQTRASSMEAAEVLASLLREGAGRARGLAFAPTPAPLRDAKRFFTPLVRVLTALTPARFSALLFVFDGMREDVWFSAAAEIRAGKIVRLATSDHFEPLNCPAGGPLARKAAVALRAVRRKWGSGPDAGLFLEKAAFFSVVESQRPLKTLNDLLKSREAILKPAPLLWRAALKIGSLFA